MCNIFLIDVYNNTVIFICIGSGLIFFIGLIDDIKGLSASSKFLFQLIATLIVIFGAKNSPVQFSFIGNEIDTDKLIDWWKERAVRRYLN